VDSGDPDDNICGVSPMKSDSPAMKHFALALILCLPSCATMRNVGEGSVNLVKKSTSATVSTISHLAKAPKMPKMPDFSIADLLPDKGPKVVEVREKDLEELPTGQELAKAHERQRRNSFWIFGGPVDFKEPTLPEAGSEMDGSLLPPRMP
jgi:hypothetical protein